MKSKFVSNDQAVSPIIGTILMVAITVIMAAIIATWAAGIKTPEAPKSIGLDILRLNQTTIQITVSSIDPVQTEVSKVVATFKNATGSNIKRTIFGDGAYYEQSISNNSDVLTTYMANTTTVNVGDSSTIRIYGFNEFMVLTVTYGDGTIKTVFSQKV